MGGPIIQRRRQRDAPLPGTEKEDQSMKVGLVLEGGALRTIFSTGVFDALLEKNVMADYVVGVSAGIAYGVSYVSKQPRRNSGDS